MISNTPSEPFQQSIPARLSPPPTPVMAPAQVALRMGTAIVVVLALMCTEHLSPRAKLAAAPRNQTHESVHIADDQFQPGASRGLWTLPQECPDSNFMIVCVACTWYHNAVDLVAAYTERCVHGPSCVCQFLVIWAVVVGYRSPALGPQLMRTSIRACQTHQ